MKHARPDYNRIQDPANKIPDDEPVFLLRGQDRHAAGALEYYASKVENQGGDVNLVRMTREHAKAMRKWQDDKGIFRNPDITDDQMKGNP